MDFIFFEFSLHFHVVARGEGIDVYDASMGENLVVDQRRESLTPKPESDVAP